MDSRMNLDDFDHVVLDANGIRGVKDDNIHLISEEEWRRMNPEHKDVGCAECTFAKDQEDMLDNLVSKKQKDKADQGRVVSVGKFTMPGWSGHLSFYLFRCPSCQEMVVNYPHGMGKYVNCLKCREGCIDLRNIIVRYAEKSLNAVFSKILN